MLPEPHIKCRYTGFTKSCRSCVVDDGCQHWQQIIGKNPNTGEAMNKHGCVDVLMMFLQLENNKFTYEVGAAVESFRNEAVTMPGMRVAQEVVQQLAEHRPNKEVKLLDGKG